MNPRKRILVIKLSSFGDIFHALPAVSNLKQALDADVDWVTQPEYVELVKCFPIVSRVIPFPRRHFWTNALSFRKSIILHQYDLVIDLQGLLKSAFAGWMARGVRRIGPSFQREGAWLFYDAVAGIRNKNRHAVEENLDVVRHLGLPMLPVVFPVQFPVQPCDEPRPRIAIVPLSRRANKNWPVARFIETAAALRAEFNASIYLFGSQADHEICARIQSALLTGKGTAGVVNLAGKTNLVEMGGWFKQMDMVVVNDSGPLHMAAALHVPVVTMFGPTDPCRTGPYGGRHRVITTDVACRPCYARVCPLKSVECMDGIPAGKVIEAARKILEARE
ncbi:MAG: glycosyltransferase family 9 protein [bacterium]